MSVRLFTCLLGVAALVGVATAQLRPVLPEEPIRPATLADVDPSELAKAMVTLNGESGARVEIDDIIMRDGDSKACAISDREKCIQHKLEKCAINRDSDKCCCQTNLCSYRPVYLYEWGVQWTVLGNTYVTVGRCGTKGRCGCSERPNDPEACGKSTCTQQYQPHRFLVYKFNPFAIKYLTVRLPSFCKCMFKPCENNILRG